jgi:polysaccharide biosynthesis protein PslH
VRILFLSPRQCWPPTSGAKLRDYHLARALGRRAEVSYVFFSQPGAAAPSALDLCCRELAAVPPPRRYTPWKIARGLVGRWPLPVVNYTSARMKAELTRLTLARTFDLVHLDSIHKAGYLTLLARQLGHARVVYDWHNIESENMLRYAKNTGSILHKAYAAATARRLAALERAVLASALGHIVCSERERLQLLAIAPGRRVEVIDNGVDAADWRAPGEASRDRLLFVGAMRYHANIDAAVEFARDIWPRVHARFPGWRLTVVGSDPVPAVLALRALAGVEITGTVPALEPYYREAVAAIAPLRYGGGTRLKILEAMAAGVPVVSTPLGAEGLEVSPGRDILLAEGEEEWIRALESLAGQPELVRQLTAAGRELVRSRYDWNALGEKLFATYIRWLADGVAPPAAVQ